MPVLRRKQANINGNNYPEVESRKKFTWGELRKNRSIVMTAQTLGITAVCGGVIFAFLPDYPIDLGGDWGKARTPEEMHQIKLAKRREIFSQDLVPAERFILTYVGSTDRGNSIPYGALEGNNGLIGKIHSFVNATHGDVWDGDVADTCLAGTAYDPTPSEIRGRAYGDISAVAGVYVEDGQEGQIITINPTLTSGVDLRFSVDSEGFLQPVDDATENVLEAYGCDDNLNN